MSELPIRECPICKKLFYHPGRVTYCKECLPKGGKSINKMRLLELASLKEMAEKRRQWDRERWHTRMQSQIFAEKERARQREKYKRLYKK